MSSWCVLCIGSAGHGTGSCKKKSTGKRKSTKDDFGLLDTKEDIEDCKDWCNRKGFQLYGTYEVAGKVGSSRQCYEAVQRFFQYCKDHSLSPILYYSGHGNKNGDWAFPDGSYFTFEDLDQIVTSISLRSIPVIMSDACYSGVWVWKGISGEPRKWHMVSASGKESAAYNRAFAKAVFRGQYWENGKCLLVEQDAIASKHYGSNVTVTYSRLEGVNRVFVMTFTCEGSTLENWKTYVSRLEGVNLGKLAMRFVMTIDEMLKLQRFEQLAERGRAVAERLIQIRRGSLHQCSRYL